MARSNRAEWAKRVERWKDSGLTAKEFASETGLNPSTLSYWSWKLGQSGGGGKPRKPRSARPRPQKAADKKVPGKFVEVSGPAVSTAPSVIEVVVGDVRVRVPVDLDDVTFARVMRTLGAAR
jgi:hypothetical protein